MEFTPMNEKIATIKIEKVRDILEYIFDYLYDKYGLKEINNFYRTFNSFIVGFDDGIDMHRIESNKHIDIKTFDHFSKHSKHLYGENYEEWVTHQKLMCDKLSEQELNFCLQLIELIKNEQFKTTEQEMGSVYPIKNFLFFNHCIVTDD